MVKHLLLEIPFSGCEGFDKVACEVSVGLVPPGMSHTSEDATPDKDGLVTLNISENSDLGGSEILNGTIPLTFTIKGNKITKQFSWTKTKDGAAGSAARIYSIEPSTLIVKKMVGDHFLLIQLHFHRFKMGNSSVRSFIFWTIYCRKVQMESLLMWSTHLLVMKHKPYIN